MAGCAAISLKVTEAPSASDFSSALIVCSSGTRFMSIKTGGATMPRRMLTTRSVPPPSGMACGLSARAAIASASVFGLMMRKSGSASISALHPYPPLPLPLDPSCPRLSRASTSFASLPKQAVDGRNKSGHDNGEAEARAWSLASALLLRRPPPFLDRLKDAVGRHRQIVEADANCIGDGVGQRRQEGGERAFARLLGAERPVRVVALDNADLDRRGILDGRHAVIEHVGSEHQPVEIGGFLAHRLAHAHPDRALHLAFDGEAVERLAAVMRDPDLVDGDDAGLLVDRDFDHLRRVGVAHGAADG